MKGDKDGESPRSKKSPRRGIEDRDPGETEDEGSPPPSKKRGTLINLISI